MADPKTPVVTPRRPAPSPPGAARYLHPDVVSAQAWDVLSLLVVFRFVNALAVRTFFQPDEYFQALEPAWDLAFGHDSGAWLTWEWEHQLRSSLHPVLFAGVYKAAQSVMDLLRFGAPFKAVMLVAMPKTVQSVFAAVADFYTWKLATLIFGADSNAPWAAVWVSVLSPWQWYCSTRTFSNSLETTLTIVALYYWPWQLFDKADKGDSKSQKLFSVPRFRVSLILAAIAVLLRPTNLLIWLGILTLGVTRLTLDGESPVRRDTLLALAREVVLCGSGVLAASVLSDRYYFGFWAFPPYKWLYFNITQSLAIFYGQMPWHYYLSQGLPLLSTTFLPFVLLGLWKASSPQPGQPVLESNILKTLSFAVLTMIGTLSVISHKEVRFIYPLLPVLHILAAPYLSFFFTSPPAAPTTQSPYRNQPTVLRHKVFLANILSINILLAGYLSVFHQPAPIAVTHFLRSEYERIHSDRFAPGSPVETAAAPELFALFLTPCHSTPWRSHLVHPGLRARALTCEPPLHTAPNSAERADYLDEADRFYRKDPTSGKWGLDFMDKELWPVVSAKGDRVVYGGEMPRFIVGFEGIEPVLREFFQTRERTTEKIELKEVWSGWNGLFSDDWRRSGRLVVWDTGAHPNTSI